CASRPRMVAGCLYWKPQEPAQREMPAIHCPEMSQLAGLKPPGVPGALGGLTSDAVVPPASSGGHGASMNLSYLPSVKAAFKYRLQRAEGFHDRSASAPRTRTRSALAR